MPARWLVLLAALLLAPFTASAQVIHACVKNNGTLKIATDPAQCGAGDTPLSWNVQGPQGVPGPSLRVLDGTGDVIGIPWGFDTVFIEELGVSAQHNTLVQLGNPTALLEAPIHFELSRCQGELFLQAENFAGFAGFLLGLSRFGDGPPDTRSLLAAGTQIGSPVQTRSFILQQDGFCQEEDLTILQPIAVTPIAHCTFDIPSSCTPELPFTFPIIPPLHTALPPE